MIITRKIELSPGSQEAWEFIQNLNYQVWKAANRIVTEQHFNSRAMQKIRAANPDASKDKLQELFSAFFGCSVKNTTYRTTREEFPELPSTVATTLNAEITSLYGKDMPEVARGQRSIRSYRLGMPIPFQASAVKMDAAGIVFMKHRFDFRLGRDRSGNRIIIERILSGVSGEYKFCDSRFQLKGKKLFLLLAVRIPDEKPPLNPEKIVGVDLGIKVPAYLGMNEGGARLAIGSADDFLAVRLRIQAQRRELQKNLKFTQGGKGRKKKLTRLDKLGQRERNMVRTINHRISADIVRFALHQNAATIHIEDLAGFGGDAKKDFFLRNWSYFELQEMIRYKAGRAGIQVRKVEAAYTSQYCAQCSKPGDYNPEAAVFRCINQDCAHCGQEVHGDYNAAINIARSDRFSGKK